MNSRTPAKILIVDDHPLVRDSMRQLLEGEPDFEVCGEAGGVREAMRMVKKASPDLATIDMSLADGSGLTLIKRIRSVAPEVRILVVSMHDDSAFTERAMRAGAMGYLNKQEASGNVTRALRQLLAGEVYLGRKTLDHLAQQGSIGTVEKWNKPSATALTNREFEVFELLGRGFSTIQIADKLNVSRKTVETHRVHIKDKLNVQSANELIMRAVQWVLEEAKA